MLSKFKPSNPLRCRRAVAPRVDVDSGSGHAGVAIDETPTRTQCNDYEKEGKNAHAVVIFIA